jgi:hypothetical protein
VGRGGVPTDATGSCAAGQTQCSGTCVNTSNDPRNCGGCGKVCASQCYAGQCVPTA